MNIFISFQKLIELHAENTWITVDESEKIVIENEKKFVELSDKYDFCVSGDSLFKFMATYMPSSLCYVAVFARVSPEQKVMKFNSEYWIK